MGGYGSGRSPGGGKKTTSTYLQLDVRRLQRKGFLASGVSSNWRWNREGEDVASINAHAGPGRLILSWTQFGNAPASQIGAYAVQIVWTHCHYGGARAWFLCPAVGCGRRVAILYGGTVFACRHCYQLTYSSQREQPPIRAFRRAQEIRMRLGGPARITDPFPPRPKGMHGRIYSRLQLEAREAERLYLDDWWLKDIAFRRYLERMLAERDRRLSIRSGKTAKH
jgi:hypothetical protein